jgi:hypothetical protein
MNDRSYRWPVAFRTALARLKTMATNSRWTLTQLQRQFAYDRLLERLYLTDQDWIVKGATACSPATSAYAEASTSTSTANPPTSRPNPTYAPPPRLTSVTGSVSSLATHKSWTTPPEVLVSRSAHT